MNLASASLAKWKALNPSEKEEETVISSIHLVDSTGKEEPSLLVLCSGTKVLSDKVCSTTTHYGELVRDLHAEVLCRRGLLRVLLEDLSSKEGLILEQVPDALPRLRDGFYLHMWVSKAPCGDYGIMSLIDAPGPASTVVDGGSSNEKITSETSAEQPKPKKTKLKGNISPSEKVYFRTKPGRIDSPIAHSLSCTNKIQLWQQIGWQGALLGLRLQAIRLKVLEIGEGYHKEHSDVFKELEIIPSTLKTRYNLITKTSPISTVWWKGIPKQERIVDGRLFGSNRPKNGVLNPKCQSSVSSDTLHRKCLSFKKESYFKEKKKNLQYQHAKATSHPPNRPHLNEEMLHFRNQILDNLL